MTDRQVIQELSLLLGVDLTDPEAVAALRQDLEYAHKMRTAYSRAGITVLTTLIGAATVGLLSLVKDWIHK